MNVNKITFETDYEFNQRKLKEGAWLCMDQLCGNKQTEKCIFSAVTPFLCLHPLGTLQNLFPKTSTLGRNCVLFTK